MNNVVLVFIFISLLYTAVMLLFSLTWLVCPEEVSYSYSQLTTVTVVVVARNEEKNIAHCLNSVVNQQYDKRLLEVIVVDDYSSDATYAIANDYCARYNFIKCIRSDAPQSTIAFKKYALDMAIKQSKGELIVTTDADCHMGLNWINTLVGYYQKHKPAMIIGPVKIDADNSLFQKFQTVEFAGLTVVTAVTAYLNKPLMCNGANLAYTRLAYEQVQGFAQINKIASGDDVLLMNKIHKAFPGKIKFIKNKEAIVSTGAISGFCEFINQRIRWSSKTFAGKNIINILLAATVYLFNCSIVAGMIAGLFIGCFYPFWIPFVISAFIINFLLLFLGLSFSGIKKYWWIIVPEQPVYVLYVIITGFAGVLKKQYIWKGRGQV